MKLRSHVWLFILFGNTVGMMQVAIPDGWFFVHAFLVVYAWLMCVRLAGQTRKQSDA